MNDFIDAWKKMQESVDTPVIEYRIYYDLNSGKILDYTTEIREGTYILVDRETFANHRFEYKVKNKKLISPTLSVGKLKPAENGTPCHPADITIITTDSNATHWKNHTYDNI
jgi:hypothetical protein